MGCIGYAARYLHFIVFEMLANSKEFDRDRFSEYLVPVRNPTDDLTKTHGKHIMVVSAYHVKEFVTNLSVGTNYGMARPPIVGWART